MELSFKSTKVFVFYVIWPKLNAGIMLLVLTPIISNRLTYIADLMIKVMLGIEVRFTTSVEEFTMFDGPKLSYTVEPQTEGLFVEASGFLFETSIVPQHLKILMVDGIPVFFNTVNPRSALPFDPFAAAFYMVSRYEEYHSHKKDRIGRYLATESIAWTGKFLDLPIVHYWSRMLEGLLMKHYPGLIFRYLDYKFTPTIDVDHAWCYLGRNPVRTAVGFGRSFMHGHMKEIANRFKVLSGIIADPYDNYDYIFRVHNGLLNSPLFFILFANYGRNDNNVTLTSERFRRLILKLDRQSGVGVHPSLSSNKHISHLEQEYRGLSEMLRRRVTISRQHFLKFSLPKTYRNLVQLGITDDYSMGYVDHIGFRAGIATPYAFFDLLNNETTTLIIHPVSVMDVTIKDHLRLSRVESLERISKMIGTIKNVHGEFTSIWHNESLGDAGHWAGWRSVYEEMIALAST
jgi:hypothetical protein